MLITHLRPTELWGKSVYDTDGRFLGTVVAIGSRRGVVRKVVVKRKTDGVQVSLLPPPETLMDGPRLVVPVPDLPIGPRLRVVH